MKAGIGGVGGYDLEPWTALDSLAWQKVQAWQLGGNFDSEVFRMLADEKLGDPKLTDALFPPYGASMPVITPLGPGGRDALDRRGLCDVIANEPGNRGDLGVGCQRRGAWRDVATAGQRILAIAGLDAGGGLVGDHQVGSNDWVDRARRRARPAARSSPTTPISGSACRRSGS